MNPEISDIKISKVLIDDTSAEAKDLNINPPEIITFKLTNASCALANLLRVFINYLPVKYLHCDVSDIKTNQYVLGENIISRVRLIPILQNTPLDTRVTIFYNNTTNDSVFVYSKHIKGKPISINGQSRILKLNPKSQIEINMIVKESNDSNNKNFGISMLQTALKYEILDYQRIYYLKDNEIGEAYIKSHKKQDKKILYYNDEKYKDVAKVFKKGYQQTSSDEQQALNKLDEYFDDVMYDNKLVTFTAEQIFPTEFLLNFKTYGNIDVKQLFSKSFDNLIKIYENLNITEEGNGYKIETYEHVVGFLYDLLKQNTETDVVMHIKYMGYKTTIFYVGSGTVTDDNLALLKKTINMAVRILTKLRQIMQRN